MKNKTTQVRKFNLTLNDQNQNKPKHSSPQQSKLKYNLSQQKNKTTQVRKFNLTLNDQNQNKPKHSSPQQSKLKYNLSQHSKAKPIRISYDNNTLP